MVCLTDHAPQQDGGYEAPLWQKQLAERREELRVGMDDPIYEYDCLRCGGDCCINTDVLIGPHDVWRIVHSDVGRALGYMTSHDLFAGEEPPFSYYLGPQSGLPVACIDRREMSEGVEVCPFLAVAYTETGPESDHRRELLRSEDGAAAGLCALESAKPTICRGYPLGRLGVTEGGPEAPVETSYIWNESDSCRRFRKDRTMTVREYVDKWGLQEAYRQSDLVNDWRMRLAEIPDGRARYLMGAMYFDFDLVGLRRAEESGWPAERRYEAVIATRPSSFEELAEKQFRLLDDALEHMRGP